VLSGRECSRLCDLGGEASVLGVVCLDRKRLLWVLCFVIGERVF